MKLLESKFYRPRRIISEHYIDGQCQLVTQELCDKVKSTSSPFEELLGSLLASINFRGDEIVIKKSHLKDFVQCTDFEVVEFDRHSQTFYASELCYFHPDYEFFLLLDEDLSTDYDKIILESGYLSVVRLSYQSHQPKVLANIRRFFDTYLEKYISQDAKISLLLKEGQDLVFKSHHIKPLAIDLTTMYNDDFAAVHQKIKHDLTHGNKGLVLLHGVAGSGKTNYIKWLTAQIPAKNFIFVPNNLIGALAEPQFMSMLIDHKNSVLVLEDCENYIRERIGGGNSSDVVSTILNIADGILSDVLECQFICTFNADLTDVDHALLRHGRLIAEYHFDKLSIEKSNQYLASINQTHAISQPMTLAELTNLDNVPARAVEQKGGFGFVG